MKWNIISHLGRGYFYLLSYFMQHFIITCVWQFLSTNSQILTRRFCSGYYLGDFPVSFNFNIIYLMIALDPIGCRVSTTKLSLHHIVIVSINVTWTSDGSSCKLGVSILTTHLVINVPNGFAGLRVKYSNLFIPYKELVKTVADESSTKDTYVGYVVKDRELPVLPSFRSLDLWSHGELIQTLCYWVFGDFLPRTWSAEPLAIGDHASCWVGWKISNHMLDFLVTVSILRLSRSSGHQLPC